MTIRIAMWSGPRNLSTAMMRAFENRSDCAVVDEPYYAAYLHATGLQHPMRAEVLAAQPTDWRQVEAQLLGKVPGGRPVFYQKHMTHHMLPEFGRSWMAQCRNAFLIRAPEDVLLSYAAAREEVTLADIGFGVQAELFDAVCQQNGQAPPVIDAASIRADPAGALGRLCAALDIPFRAEMLTWPAGPRKTDGVWAPSWYEAVQRSTGFAPPAAEARRVLPEGLRCIAAAAAPFYERLARYRL